MKQSLCFLLLLALLPALLSAQEAPPLSTQDVQLETRPDAFGVELQVVTGLLANNSDMAYTSVTIYVDLYDADGEAVGEGFGYPVDACGTALLDLELQPGARQSFVAGLELYEDEAEIAEMEVTAQGRAIPPEPPLLPDDTPGLVQLSSEEVVLVEWLDAQTLRYGVGCAGNVFTELDWYSHSLATGETEAIEHPQAAAVTPALIERTGITRLTQSGEDEPALYYSSMLSFPPGQRRMLYQNDLHIVFSAEPDGSFPRVLHEGLHPYSLRGFIWLEGGRFLAYYFGAFGDPVRYFTGDVDGQRISGLLWDLMPSVTVPGATEDGRFVIIGTTIDGLTGYYVRATTSQETILLFEAELPGNNWPAPVQYRRSPDARFVYLVRPVEGQALLQCYHREAETLHSLTPLPLLLNSDERAWSWMSPDYNTLALSANGRHSGLWLVDLNTFDECR